MIHEEQWNGLVCFSLGGPAQVGKAAWILRQKPKSGIKNVTMTRELLMLYSWEPKSSERWMFQLECLHLQ